MQAPDTDHLAAAEIPLGSSPEALAAQLRAGIHPPDSAFDQYLPEDFRGVSERHWTPLHVVSRAARWLLDAGARSVVDVGSGPGKFCVAAALCGELTCTGLEQRPRLVSAARDLARRFRVEDRVLFREGLFGESDIPRADAYYFYNPFLESLFDTEDRIDDDVDRGHDRYVRELRLATGFLRSLPPDSLVLTYYGFGGQIPRGYEEVRTDSRIPALLRLFRKAQRRP
jgi:SAM-dependent methyltransferase